MNTLIQAKEFSNQGKEKYERRHTVVQVPVPPLLHGLLKAVVENLVKCADPLVHLRFTVCSQQERALILHLQLESKPAHFAVLKARDANLFLKASTTFPLILK